MKKILIVIVTFLLYSCTTNTDKKMENKHFDFYTQYGQFYISSDSGEFLDGNSGESNSMEDSKQSLKERLIIEKNALVVFTQSYGKVKGEIEILKEMSNNSDYSKYDHVVEGGINVESGELQILSWPGSETELEMKIKPGKYRVRIYSSNFASVVDDDGDDYYRIEVWPSNDMEKKVLKQFNDPF